MRSSPRLFSPVGGSSRVSLLWGAASHDSRSALLEFGFYFDFGCSWGQSCVSNPFAWFFRSGKSVDLDSAYSWWSWRWVRNEGSRRHSSTQNLLITKRRGNWRSPKFFRCVKSDYRSFWGWIIIIDCRTAHSVDEITEQRLEVVEEECIAFMSMSENTLPYSWKHNY